LKSISASYKCRYLKVRPQWEKYNFLTLNKNSFLTVLAQPVLDMKKESWENFENKSYSILLPVLLSFKETVQPESCYVVPARNVLKNFTGPPSSVSSLPDVLASVEV
jgi:hypothetical protein